MNGKWYKKNEVLPQEILSSYGNNPICGLPKISSFENINPNKILVEMESRPHPLPKSDRNEISNFLHSLGKKYWEHIPLKEIFNKLDSHGIVPLQEDGTRWSGMLLGDKECGTPGSENQKAVFQLAFRRPDGYWSLSTNCIVLLWCRMSHSGKYEVVTYVS